MNPAKAAADKLERIQLTRSNTCFIRATESKVAQREDIDAHQAAFLANGGTITVLAGPTYSQRPIAPITPQIQRPPSHRTSKAAGVNNGGVKPPAGMCSQPQALAYAIERGYPNGEKPFVRDFKAGTGPKVLCTTVVGEKKPITHRFTSFAMVDEWLAANPNLISARGVNRG